MCRDTKRMRRCRPGKRGVLAIGENFCTQPQKHTQKHTTFHPSEMEANAVERNAQKEKILEERKREGRREKGEWKVCVRGRGIRAKKQTSSPTDMPPVTRTLSGTFLMEVMSNGSIPGGLYPSPEGIPGGIEASSSQHLKSSKRVATSGVSLSAPSSSPLMFEV